MNPDEILKSIREGRFYSSMAPKIIVFRYESNYLRIESSPISRINIITVNGEGFSLSLETIERFINDWRDPYKRKLLCKKLVRDFDYVSEASKQEIYLETINNEKLAIEIKNKGILNLRLKKLKKKINIHM